MVSVIQCPNPKCRKYMLVEEAQQGKEVLCLLCKASIKVGAAPRPGAAPPKPRVPR
jgi:hypothetical protein